MANTESSTISSHNLKHDRNSGNSQNELSWGALLKYDLPASFVVFLVALPLCLGIALASNAPLFSGIIAGVVGGIVVGILSGSHTSVSGPAAGLTAIVAAQIATLGSYQTFLLAVVIGGILQIVLGIVRAGALSAFFPSSVIKGLLAAIGVILILKQVPHLFGHDTDPEGEMAFQQPDKENTFTEIGELIYDIHPGATVVGLASLALLVFWDRCKPLKKSSIPAPLIAVIAGVVVHLFLKSLGGVWVIQASHRVNVPIAGNMAEFATFLTLPDFTQLGNPAVYIAAVTIAIVASLETLLNLEGVDKLDKRRRQSPPSRELFAQGVGNFLSGMIGGLPVTSVIIRGSVNINMGAHSKASSIMHGTFLLVCVAFFPIYLNMIPLSCLAAILLLTGFKLASPALFRNMWSEGRYQFLPFIITLVAIVLTDLLIGIIIGLATSVVFILVSNLRRPIRRTLERHVGGEVLHIELANQVSFLNRAALEKVLDDANRGSHLLLDARRTDYIDPDVLSLIKEFKLITAPARGVQVSLRGFRDRYNLSDEIRFVDHSTRELQEQLTPAKVLNLLQEGNERFRSGHRLDREFHHQVGNETIRQHPLAVVLSGVHTSTPAELIFDMGLGDLLCVRIAANIAGPKVMGSIEYGCAMGGAKLILVLGNTDNAMIRTAIELAISRRTALEATGCDHLDVIINEIQRSIDLEGMANRHDASTPIDRSFIDKIARLNVLYTVRKIASQSNTIRTMIDEGRVAIVGAMFNVASGEIDYMLDNVVQETTLADRSE